MLLILRMESWVGGPADQRTLPPDHEFQRNEEGSVGTLLLSVATTAPSKRYVVALEFQIRVYCVSDESRGEMLYSTRSGR